MRQIDMQTWPRREHFKVFKSFDYPYFSMCANVDLTAFCPYIKQHGISLNIALIYVFARTANEIPEFRHRVRGEEVVEHEQVHPSTTILTDDDLFSFCTIEYSQEFSTFSETASVRIAAMQENPTLSDEPGQDDLLFMTAIPWVSFTSFMHPLHLHPADSVPRFAWGKFFQDGATIKLPLSVQGHHALMDGVHVGRFYRTAAEYLQRPDFVLGKE